MGQIICCCCRCNGQKKNNLDNAQNMTVTDNGEQISTKVMTHFATLQQIEDRKTHLKEESDPTAILFDQPYNQLSQIDENLYLSGIGAIYEENIRSKDIKCLIEVTFEGAKYDIKGIEFFRIPVADEENSDLYPYFDEVSDKIEKNVRNNIKTVVFCMGGVSRSATIVIAYLMKHRKMTLKEAFNHVVTRRPCVCPNFNFIAQLIKYEQNLYKNNFFQWIDVTDRYGRTHRVPDFYHKPLSSTISIESVETFAIRRPGSSLILSSSESSSIIDRVLSENIKNRPELPI